MRHEKIQVEYRSGYKGNEYPLAFVFQDKRLEVSEIVDRWYEGGLDPQKPVIDYFRVKTDDGRTFILMYAGHLDQWFIQRDLRKIVLLQADIGLRVGLQSGTIYLSGFHRATPETITFEASEAGVVYRAREVRTTPSP